MNNTYDTVNHSADTGGSVNYKFLPIDRIMTLSKDEGGVHSSGIVDSRSVYDRLYEMTDPTILSILLMVKKDIMTDGRVRESCLRRCGIIFDQ